MEPRRGVVLFAYGGVAGLERLLPVVLSSPVDRIVIAHEGEDPGLQSLVSRTRDARVVWSHSPVRLGKARAYNRALPLLSDLDIVFLVSADIDFDSSIFDRMAAPFSDPHVGVVVPQVLPPRARSGVERVAGVLWELHDIQLGLLSRGSANVHGGEFLALREPLLTALPGDTVNEDAYLCIHALQCGFQLRYMPQCRVLNLVPTTLPDLLTQRRRIIFGHRQLARLGKRPEVLSSPRLKSLGNLTRVLLRFVKAHPSDLPYLAFLIVEEIYANALARRDMDMHVDHSKWTTISANIARTFRRTEEEA